MAVGFRYGEGILIQVADGDVLVWFMVMYGDVWRGVLCGEMWMVKRIAGDMVELYAGAARSVVVVPLNAKMVRAAAPWP